MSATRIPQIVAAISEQAGLLLHTSNLYSIDWQQQLAQKLTELSGMERAFFNNSGAEANETALKLARLYGWRKGIEQPLVVVMANAFHGRTLGTLSASDGPAVRLGFNELPGDFVKVPFGDLEALEQVQQKPRRAHRGDSDGADPGRKRRATGAARLPESPARTVQSAWRGC